jgi:hypothetical protein
LQLLKKVSNTLVVAVDDDDPSTRYNHMTICTLVQPADPSVYLHLMLDNKFASSKFNNNNTRLLYLMAIQDPTFMLQIKQIFELCLRGMATERITYMSQKELSPQHTFHMTQRDHHQPRKGVSFNSVATVGESNSSADVM